MDNKYAQDAKLFKALCDEKRLKIIDLLRSGEKCACTLIEEMGIGQSALSYHMKILCDSQLVSARPQGKWTHYCLNQEAAHYASQRVLELTSLQLNEKCSCKSS